MMTKTKIPSFEECITIAKYFYESMHDYIFLYDIEKDEYEISYKAYKKFRLPSNHFKNVKKNHKLYVYEEDYPILLHDLELVTSGKMNIIWFIDGWEEILNHTGLIVEVNF